MATNIKRLNHAVLWVNDVARSAEFYQNVLGFTEVERMGDFACFMRGSASDNHHDLAVMRAQGPSPVRPGATGLYHLAWQVETIEELVEAAVLLSQVGSLAGMSDHGVSKSLYAKDPDGIEFELMWMVPREDWGDAGEHGYTRHLDLRKELEKYGVATAVRD